MSERLQLWQLRARQAAPLSLKIQLTKSRIRAWVDRFGEDGVYISFSGGKDSTVLLTIARDMYPNIPAVFSDTGLEYPEIRKFVKTFIPVYRKRGFGTCLLCSKVFDMVEGTE